MRFREPPGTLAPLANLVRDWTQLLIPPATVIIGIDGPGGAGKSSLCAALAAHTPSITIVHMDDFFVPPGLRTSPASEIGRQLDWRRVVEQILAPLAKGNPGHYQRFDWATATLQEWHSVPSGGLVILEGVYSTREDIAPYLDQRIWVTIPRDLGLERGIARDGEHSREWWMTDWIQDEDRYILIERPGDLAHTTIDGTNGQRHYDLGQYVHTR